MTYPERLQILKTESIELRRLKFDLNMIYCAIRGLNALDSSTFFDMCDSSSRGHSLKIRKQFSRVNCRAFSFANCCVDVWNSLNNEVVFASSLTNLNSRMLILVFFTLLQMMQVVRYFVVFVVFVGMV